MKPTAYTRPKKSLNADMNVVPYIDVMLVLLIIFMVTAPMLTTGVEIDLPKEKTANIQKDTELPVIVSMKADGSLFISEGGTSDEPITKDGLMAKISELAEKSRGDDGKSTLQVMINADASNEYRAVMNLMAGLQQAGVNKVGLLTDSPTKKSKKSKKSK